MSLLSKISVLILLLVAVGCNKMKEPLQWESDYTVPLAHGSLGMESLIPDSLLTLDVDSSIILKFEGNLLDMDFTEILVIPDTIIQDTFQAPFPTPIDFNPGQVFINIPDEHEVQLNGIYLTSTVIAKGTVDYELFSTVNGIVTYTYSIPSAKDWTGNSFTKSITVPAAQSGSSSMVAGSFDLSGYYLDMTGQSGVKFNTIETTINCKISESNSSAVSVSSADIIRVNNHFRDIVIDQAEGYFGQHELNTGLEYSTLNGFSKWISGAIDVEDLNVDLVVKNGLGVDLFFKLNELIAEGASNSVSLSHSLVGELISLSRATRYYDSIVPTLYSADLSATNSNIDDFLEVLPHELGYDLELEVNPLGNVSGYNDFYNRYAPMGIFIDASLPLSFIASDLTLEDTLQITLDDDAPINSLTIKLDLENGFPLAADLELAVLDGNDKIISRIFSPTLIESAILDQTGKVSEVSNSHHEIVISALDLQRLKEFGRMVLTLVFNTPGNDHVVIYDSYRLNYVLKADANVTVTVGNE